MAQMTVTAFTALCHSGLAGHPQRILRLEEGKEWGGVERERRGSGGGGGRGGGARGKMIAVLMMVMLTT